MRTISGHQAAALALLWCFGGSAAAQDADVVSPPILIPSQSSVFNQNSVNLPSAPSVSGQDVVRGADGTTCQSAVASGGPYLDVGVLQSQDFYARDTAALYGRVVFPLGRRSRRVDCTQLYKLEIERMRMELELLRVGTSFGDMLAVGDGEAMVNEPAAPAGGVVVPPPQRETSPRSPVQAEAREPERPPRDRTAEGAGQAFFVQAGAFSEASRAADRLDAVARHAGRRDGTLKPLNRRGETLFRTLFGPMPLDEAQTLCAELPWDCFVAEL